MAPPPGDDMSWYAADHPYRAAISIDNTAGAAAAHDISFSIDDGYDLFWDNVLPGGADVRITGSDGRTLLTYQLVSFDKAARTGTFEIDGLTMAAGITHQVFLYWGDPAAVAAGGSFTAATPKTGYLEFGKPGPVLFDGAPERAGAERPRNVLAKHPDETLLVWVDFRSRLQVRSELAKGRPYYEEIASVAVDAYVAEVVDNSVVTKGASRCVDQGTVAVALTAGTDGTDYTVRVTAVTTRGNTLISTIWMRVRATDEA